MNIAFVGSRNFPDWSLIQKEIDALPVGVTVISGGARGVDSVSIELAKKRGLAVRVFTADWASYGKAAGMIRNQEIVKHSDEVIAFWDGKSRGTKNTIKLTMAANKPLRIIRP